MTRTRSLTGNALVFLGSLVLGLAVFSVIQWLVDTLWGEDGVFGGYPPLWALLGLPLGAAVVVGWARRRQNGHDPMAGLAIGPVQASAYPYLLAAIAVGLAGGVVLGPEVAMIFTGGLMATVVGSRFGLDPGNAAKIGGLGGLLALFVGPAVRGSTGPPEYSFDVADLLPALLGAAGAVAAVAVARLIGGLLSRARPGDAVSMPLLLGGGLALGAVAAVYQDQSGESARLVLTSGEHMIASAIGLGSVGLIAWTVAAKMVVYGVSLGAGFRGGPYFPAMFAGAGAGAVAAGLLDGSVHVAATAGLLAAVTYLAHVGWRATAIIGIVVGLFVGGPAMLPAALLGSAVGRAVPRAGGEETG